VIFTKGYELEFFSQGGRVFIVRRVFAKGDEFSLFPGFCQGGRVFIVPRVFAKGDEFSLFPGFLPRGRDFYQVD
jgi:hypothetical protein